MLLPLMPPPSFALNHATYLFPPLLHGQGAPLLPPSNKNTIGLDGDNQVESFPPTLHRQVATLPPPTILPAFTEDMIDPRLRTPCHTISPQHHQTTRPPLPELPTPTSVDVGSVDKETHEPLMSPSCPSQSLGGWAVRNPGLDVIPSRQHPQQRGSNVVNEAKRKVNKEAHIAFNTAVSEAAEQIEKQIARLAQDHGKTEACV
jgi:hypothetical protein